MTSSTTHHTFHMSKKQQAALALAALGVVYGDIGTSPLYAFKEAFTGTHGLTVGPENVLAALSALLWAVIVIVAIGNPTLGIIALAIGISSWPTVARLVRAEFRTLREADFVTAARSLGFRQGQTLRMVVLPQAVKNILPALGNEVVTMVKESSICSTLGMVELMFAAKTVATSTYISLAPYVLAALMYFCITYPAGKAIEALERRMRRGDKH